MVVVGTYTLKLHIHYSDMVTYAVLVPLNISVAFPAAIRVYQLKKANSGMVCEVLPPPMGVCVYCVCVCTCS